jgi:hypothetical protein
VKNVEPVKKEDEKEMMAKKDAPVMDVVGIGRIEEEERGAAAELR